MNKKVSIIVILLYYCSLIFAQSVSIPEYSLTQINTSINISGLPDSVNSYKITCESEEDTIQLLLKVKENKAFTQFIFEKSGTYKLINSDRGDQLASIRIIPGWLSIVPPLLAILLALLIRQVITSLAAGIFVGAFFIFDYNPFTAFLRFVDYFILNSLAEKGHITVILFTLLIGGMVGVISANGGTSGLANQITKLAKSARSGMVASWLMGIAIFFDDYANSLIVGNMMRPITDKLKISREKLAYIVDSTAAPVASLMIMSTWIGYELGLIDAGLTQIGFSESAYDVFLNTIPYRFYPIAALFFVLLISFTGKDFGPMLKAERNSRKNGNKEPEIKSSENSGSDYDLYSGEKSRWYNGAIPVLVILFGTITGLIFTGLSTLSESGIKDYGIREIISSGDSYYSLLWASFGACVAAILLSVSQKILTLEKAVSSWFKGVQSMLLACTILVLAWAISLVTNELYTADFILAQISNSIDARLLPVIVFFVCAVSSFATGTSWGTMAIIMPIVIPLGWKLSVSSGLDTESSSLIIYGVVSSVLAGSVFGDHCSPIADTTILSSLASGCNHMDHVKTQLVYALTVGFVCMLIGDLLTAYGLSPYIAILLIFGVISGILFLFGKKVEVINTD